jgi:Maltose acetyltransferase
VPDPRSQRERMLAGDPYIADDPELAPDSLRAMRLMAKFNQGAADSSGDGDASSRSFSEQSARTPRSGLRSTANTATKSRSARRRARELSEGWIAPFQS